MKKGFTLIEIIIVITALALLSGVAFSTLASFRERQLLSGLSEDIASLIRSAQSNTLSSKGDTRYGIHFETDGVTVFQGTYAEGAPGNTEISLPSPLSLLHTIDGGGNDIFFSRLSGEASGSATATLSLPDGAARIIIIDRVGGVTLR